MDRIRKLVSALLLLLAVAVPLTAAVASAVLRPARGALSFDGKSLDGKPVAAHAALRTTGAHAIAKRVDTRRVAAAGSIASTQHAAKPIHKWGCDDRECGDCQACAVSPTCTAHNALALAADAVAAQVPVSAIGPQVEFLREVQERPPRTA